MNDFLGALLDAPDLWCRLQEESRPIVIYGMGNGADKLIERLDERSIPYADFFASDGFVRGHSFHGKRVLSFREIKEKYDDFVILLSFASSRREVLDLLYGMAEEYTLFLPDLPVVGCETFNATFAKKHATEIRQASDMWADSESATLFHSVISYKFTGNISFLRNAHQTKDEIYALLPKNEIKFAVDLGAYRGDTVLEMVEYFPSLREVLAVEPDRKNFSRLQGIGESVGIRLTPLHAAVWDAEGEAVFHASGNRNSSILAASHEYRDSTVPLVTVDSLSSAIAPVDYIKYDVEGAEKEALLGSRETIKRDRPSLLVSVYHRSEDLFLLPLLLRELCEGYRFYLRRTECLPAWELSVLAIPEEKII